jgi:hypothetical protein
VSGEAEFHQHSGWLIPLGLLGVVVALCGFFLLYYLRPQTVPFRNSPPTAAATAIELSVRGLRLHIPARYIESRAARSGGDQDVVPLFAALPDMRGFSQAENALFAGNAADSPVIHLQLRADINSLDTKARLQRIYMPYIVEPKGETTSFGLTRYVFRANSGYGRSDLFAGTEDGFLLLCERPAQDVPSPNCLAIDRPIAPGVSLSYRFKRAHLSRWQAIGDGVNRLVSGFRK